VVPLTARHADPCCSTRLSTPELHDGRVVHTVRDGRVKVRGALQVPNCTSLKDTRVGLWPNGLRLSDLHVSML